MIAYAIQAAQNSKYIENVYVSTDDREISEISKTYGAKIPFIRPKELSDDLTPTVPVISHAVKELIKLGCKLENICCIYPCVPLLTSDIIDKAYLELVKKDKLFTYPVTSYSHPIQRAMKKDSNGQMSFFSPEHELTRTQDLEPSFHDMGQFYWGTAEAWLSSKKMHTDGIGVYVNSKNLIDIDNDEDWVQAELIFNYLNQRS